MAENPNADATWNETCIFSRCLHCYAKLNLKPPGHSRTLVAILAIDVQ